MAATVNALLTDIDLAESATPWTTGSLDPAKFVQGSNSVGWYASKNARSVNGVSSKSIAHAAGDHLYWWNASDVVALAEAQTTGTTTASGVTIRVTLANGAYREWHVAGSDTWDGGWRCFVVDLGHTGTHLYASSGTWTTGSNITDVDIYFDLSNSGNIRNVPANTYSDAIRVGTGLAAYGATAFDIQDIADQDALVSNRWGILETIEPGIVVAQGEIILGDDASTTACNFNSQDEKLIFATRDGTKGYGLVSDTLYNFNAVGNATGDTDIVMGVKVGTGDTATGRSGSDIIGGSGATVNVDLDDGNVNSVKLYGSKFQGLKGTIDATGLVAADEIMGTFFDGCDRLTPGAATYRNITVLNSTAITTDGAVIWSSTVNIKNSSLLNNSRAVVFESSTGTPFTFTGLNFAGNTFDVRNESGTAITINVAGGGNASTKEEASGTITINNTVTTTIVGVPSGAEWRLYDDSGVPGELGTTELDGAESHTGGNITYDDNYTGDNAAVLQVLADNFEEFQWYFTLGANPQTINVDLVPETNT